MSEQDKNPKSFHTPKKLIGHERVSDTIDKITQDIKVIERLCIDHPFRLAYLAILEEYIDYEEARSRCVELIAETEVSFDVNIDMETLEANPRYMVNTFPKVIQKLKLLELHANLADTLFQSDIRMKVVKRMCRNISRNMALEELKNNALASLLVLSEEYDKQKEKYNALLSDSFVDSDAYVNMQIFIKELVDEAQQYNDINPSTPDEQ